MHTSSNTIVTYHSVPRHEFRRGLRQSLPVMLGFIPFALVLGAQAAGKGLSAQEVPLMTGLNFGGGSEFAAISMWTSPPQLLLIVAMSVLVNSRHILMGAALRSCSPWVVSLLVSALTLYMVPGAWYVVAGTAAGLGTQFIGSRR